MAGTLYRLSRCILLAHEDKVFEGAIVASMSIPWGETKGDNDLGGYHLVWTRDLVQSATALLATGQTGTPLRALIWLAVIQRPDGSFPQNSWINGNACIGPGCNWMKSPRPFCWPGVCGAKASRWASAIPAPMISRAAAYLILAGTGHGAGTLGGKRRLLALDAGRGHRRPGLRGGFCQTAHGTGQGNLFLLMPTGWRRTSKNGP